MLTNRYRFRRSSLAVLTVCGVLLGAGCVDDQIVPSDHQAATDEASAPADLLASTGAANVVAGSGWMTIVSQWYASLAVCRAGGIIRMHFTKPASSLINYLYTFENDYHTGYTNYFPVPVATDWYGYRTLFAGQDTFNAEPCSSVAPPGSDQCIVAGVTIVSLPNCP
jgi:hypothetical protein